MRKPGQHPIQRLRHLTTFILLSGFVLYAPIVFYGASIKAFGSSKIASIPSALLITVIIFLIPTIAIWKPNKTLLFIGGLFLLLPLYCCIIFLVNGKIAAIVAIPLAIYYYASYQLWKNPNPEDQKGT